MLVTGMQYFNYLSEFRMSDDLELDIAGIECLAIYISSWILVFASVAK